MPTFDFARPFQFVFEDPNWLKKVLLLAVFFFIPLVGPFVVMGYQIRVMRQIADGNDAGLPEIVFGEDLVNGLKLIVIVAGYMLPGMLIYFGGTILGVILSAALGGNDPNSTAAGLATIPMFGGMCIGGPLFFVGALLSPVGMVRYADTGEIGAAFRFGEVFAFIKNNAINILLAIVVGMIAQFIAQFGIILCFIGVFLTAAFANVVQGHAWGQVLKIDRARGGAPVTTPSTPRVAGAF
jgi:hypothetical protein